MTIQDLRPGDKFTFKEKNYLVIDMEPSGFFAGSTLHEYVCALDLQTYKVMGFDKDCEVSINEEY